MNIIIDYLTEDDCKRTWNRIFCWNGVFDVSCALFLTPANIPVFPVSNMSLMEVAAWPLH